MIFRYASQSVFGRLATYEDANAADGLGDALNLSDPMRIQALPEDRSKGSSGQCQGNMELPSSKGPQYRNAW